MKIVNGENSDLFINGHKVHVQTEDWGHEKQYLMSRVFKDGSVFKTFRLTYDKIDQVEIEMNRRSALVRFHQTVIDWSYQEI